MSTQKPDFNALWNSCVVTSEPSKAQDIKYYFDVIKANFDRYEAVRAKTGVPACVIAVIHMLEGSCDFSTHLHNGDPLSARTVNVPAGRPRTGNPPFTWIDSAVDALGYDDLGNGDWSNMAYTLNRLEEYNGLGYRDHGIYSPYIWSYTNQYTRGKYVSDGQWDAYAVSDQVGAATMLKYMQQHGLWDLGGAQPAPTDPKAVSYPYVPLKTPWVLKTALKLGSQGRDVADLYCGLIGLGYMGKAGVVTDYLNVALDDAVRYFQKKQGLTADGAVGPVTAKRISDMLKAARGAPSVPGGNVTSKLCSFYSIHTNYDKVYEAVVNGWFGTTSNACTAFLSEALRQSGYPVPHGPYLDGDISTWTFSLSGWLISKGWKKITNPNDLQPGDVCFTLPSDPNDDHPAHVYMFQSWQSKAASAAYVVDNQEFTHVRNIGEGGGGFNFTPYWYHVRIG